MEKRPFLINQLGISIKLFLSPNGNTKPILEAEEGDVDETIDESPLLQRQKRGSGGHRKRKNKNRNKYSDLQDDFSNAGSYGYQDYYGGMRRHRDCDKRMLRVSFRDLNW